MKQKIALILIIVLSICASNAQVKIGDNPNTINSSSLLELQSSDKVLVVTRISNAEMNALAPLNGALVYNTDENCLFQFSNNSWVSLCSNIMSGGTILTGAGITTITGTGTTIDPYIITSTEVDGSLTNELQTISINGQDLTLSNGGGTITIPTSVGPQGPIGLTGATGPQGPAGNDGADGADGAVGPQGPIGLTGATGPQGPAGNDGADGADGAVGPQGPIGLTGATGPQGPAGNDGADGADGAVGPQGPIGLTGATGPQGPDGNDGADGADGAVGPQGPIGLTGATGPQGPAGNDGADGADGAVGPQGPIGLTGATGPQGPDGNDGADGADGAVGPQGPQGIQGPAGADGVSPTFTITRETIGYIFAAGLTQGDGTNLFNINSTVVRNSQGRYTVTFPTPHPNGANYVVTLGPEGDRDLITSNPHVNDNNKTANGFEISIVQGNALVDVNWSFNVTATRSVIVDIVQN
ncbi:hypothetical protein D7030_12015 [Flavobacteriaceae bacterium AU392]|nr:hypothetical protein D7030_12015 [Flavobacteriaceae bacterium AU392]